MPGLTGIAVAKRINDTGLPCAVVYCTAFNDHAVQAFDAGALDCVLKPLEAERFAQAVARVQPKLAAGSAQSASRLSAQLLSLLQQTQQPTHFSGSARGRIQHAHHAAWAR